jgi:hypothetical protein
LGFFRLRSVIYGGLKPPGKAVKTKSLTIDRLKEVLSYETDTGNFRWKSTWHNIQNGKIAGSTDKGYRMIVIDKISHHAGRLAWFWVNGVWPRLLRYQNGNKLDTRMENLREGFYLETKHDFRTKEGKSAYGKEYREANRAEFSHRERLKNFGIDRKQFGDMLLAQNGCCAICKQPETATRNGRIKALAVDHCHETGKIRSLLCVQCNTGLGKFKDDRNLMLAAIKYLDHHKGVEHVAAKLELVRNES